MTVLEYSGPLDSLSATDVDQKLVNSRLEECSVCVDTTVRRLVETVLSTSRTRCQRDLGELYSSLMCRAYCTYSIALPTVVCGGHFGHH